MSSPIPTGNIFEENPYDGHPNLTATQAEVLWEYAKLAQIVKLVCTGHWPRIFFIHKFLSIGWHKDPFID